MKSRALLLSLASVPVLVLLACNAQSLDVGSTDAGVFPDVTTQNNAEASADPTTEVPPGLTVDGVSCPDVVITTGYNAWPHWTFDVAGPCPPFDTVWGRIDSESNFAYPQPCSVATRLVFSFPPDSDAGVADFVADGTTGECSIISGPSTDVASTPLAFDATVVSQANPARTHRLTFRPGRAGRDGGAPPADGGDGGDGGDGRTTAAGRPNAVACAGERPAGVRDSAATGECAVDADCAAGTAGRCSTRSVGGVRKNVCTYHRCESDSMCTGTGVCGCGVGSLSGQNLCLSNSNCRVDADCASGEKCAYSNPTILRSSTDPQVFEGNEVGGVNYGGNLGYFCTTPQDTCYAATRPNPGSGPTCAYYADRMRWGWAAGP